MQVGICILYYSRYVEQVWPSQLGKGLAFSCILDTYLAETANPIATSNLPVNNPYYLISRINNSEGYTKHYCTNTYVLCAVMCGV